MWPTYFVFIFLIVLNIIRDRNNRFNLDGQNVQFFRISTGYFKNSFDVLCLVLWYIRRTFTKFHIWRHKMHYFKQWLEIRWIDHSDLSLMRQNFEVKGNSWLIFFHLSFEIHILKRYFFSFYEPSDIIQLFLDRAPFMYSLSLMDIWWYFFAIIYHFQMFYGFIFWDIQTCYFCAFSHV